MAIDDQHVALPKLYGGPAYARPPSVVAHSPRPFDPDDLPIEAERTAADVAHLEHRARPARRDADGEKLLRGRPFRLRAIAGRIIGED